MDIIGKGFTLEEFNTYVQSLNLSDWQPKFIVVHNTSEPTLDYYQNSILPKVGGAQWMLNLASYYSGLGWHAGPHLFVAPDKIYVFSPLTVPGTHTPSWNSITWGVETVGEYEEEAFADPVKSNLIAALAILHKKAGLRPDNFSLGKSGLHFHKEDKKTTHKECPGKNINKGSLVTDVLNYMGPLDSHIHVSDAVATAKSFLLSYDELTKIEWVQAKLGLDVDGIVGSKTREAVKAFQSAHNLVDDGIAGPLTRQAIKQFITGDSNAQS